MVGMPAGYRGIAFDLRGHAASAPNAVVDATRGPGILHFSLFSFYFIFIYVTIIYIYNFKNKIQ